MTDLSFVSATEYQRILSISGSTVDRTALFATCNRINTLYAIKRAGSGHIGSSFSSLDIVSWLLLNELRRTPDGQKFQDVYFSSKGHDVPGLYATLIGLGLLPFEKLHALRQLGGLPGHPDIHTPHIEANTGSLGMGISKAKGMVRAHRLQGQDAHIYVLTGDGELQEGQFWESLVSATNHNLYEITVIVDHNKIQSDTWVKQVNDLGDLEKKFTAYGWHVARCDGHDLAALERVLNDFKAVTERPKILIADTVKGQGISFMASTAMKPEDKLYRFHSGAPDDDAYTKGVAELVERANRQLQALGAAELSLETVALQPKPMPQAPQKLVAAYAQALVAEAELNPKLVVLDADLILDCGLIPFAEKFPDRFVECGIAEQDMVSQAGGMALKGLLPLVHSFACFLSTRPNEQIYNNATEHTKVIYVGSLAGLLPGGPGHSHQSVRDIAGLSAVPGVTLLEPADETEVALALDYCVNRTEQSCYLRLVSIPCEVPYTLPQSYHLTRGQGVTLREGANAIIIGYGPVLLPQAYWAAEKLEAEHGLTAKVINLPWLNQVDTDWLKQTVADYAWVFTLDNHYLKGGQGEMIASHLGQWATATRVQSLGVTDIPRCGQNADVLKAHGLDADSLVAAIKSTLKG
ncbi:transketolase [filamentous cyanobacterium CCP5]|nr:transketolase [filamentous cyanobacterium CCP5]